MLFSTVQFKTSVQLTAREVEGDLEETIKHRLRQDLEGRCSRYGFVKPDSVEIVRRSAGQLVKQHFNGHVQFDMVCRADVCNPHKGLVVNTRVVMRNEMGVLAEAAIDVGGKKVPVLDVIVPLRAAGIASTVNIAEAAVGDTLFVEVLSKRYQLNDKKISIIGRAVSQHQSEDVRGESKVTVVHDVDADDAMYDVDADISEDGSDDQNEAKAAAGSDGEDESELVAVVESDRIGMDDDDVDEDDDDDGMYSDYSDASVDADEFDE